MLMIDITGQKFGRLSVVSRDQTAKRGEVCWFCLCECGKHSIVRGYQLGSGGTKSCGCVKLGDDFIGRKFGRLTVLSRAHCVNSSGQYPLICQCECGEKIAARRAHLINGSTKSCGCLLREHCARVGRASKTHGHSAANGSKRSPRYVSWNGLRVRCGNSRFPAYVHVSCCKAWKSFEVFLADLGARPENTSIGRFGDIGGYTCGNCEECRANGWERNASWQTPEQQSLEKKIKNWNKKLVRIHALQEQAA